MVTPGAPRFRINQWRASVFGSASCVTSLIQRTGSNQMQTRIQHRTNMSGAQAYLPRQRDDLCRSDRSIRRDPRTVRHVGGQQAEKIADSAHVTNGWNKLLGHESVKALSELGC
jgi:hypothetical protein